MVKRFRNKNRAHIEYLAGKTLLWFGYFVGLGLLLLIGFHG